MADTIIGIRYQSKLDDFLEYATSLLSSRPRGIQRPGPNTYEAEIHNAMVAQNDLFQHVHHFEDCLATMADATIEVPPKFYDLLGFATSLTSHSRGQSHESKIRSTLVHRIQPVIRAAILVCGRIQLEMAQETAIIKRGSMRDRLYDQDECMETDSTTEAQEMELERMEEIILDLEGMAEEIEEEFEEEFLVLERCTQRRLQENHNAKIWNRDV